MPPETTNSAKSSAMNCTYSTPVAISGPVPAFTNIQIVVGTPSRSATDSWEDSFSHQCEVFGMIGKSAMHASIATKGSRLHQG